MKKRPDLTNFMSLTQSLKVSKEQRYSAIITLIITLIIITPLCGFLFQCGCDWPWAGLDSKCNFYTAHAEHKCPWCVSMRTGMLSTGIAIFAGVCAAMAELHLLTGQQAVTKITLRTLLGIIAFLLMASLTSGIAALRQDYPLGIGGYIIAVKALNLSNGG